MANSPDVANLYSSVIKQVIQDVRQDFINMGVDEQALFDLQNIWEQKLLASKVFKASDYPMGLGTMNQNTGGFFFDNTQIPSTYRQVPPNASMPHHPSQYIQQMLPNQGSAQLQHQQHPYHSQQPLRIDQMRPPPPTNQRPANPKNIPQFDGPDDDEDDQHSSLDKVSKLDVTKSAGTSTPEESLVVKEQDELNSDLDDPDSDIEQGADIDDLLLCLYEKVHRARNKWKCNFKSGIFHIDGQDYAFNRLNGDFEW